MLLRVLLQVQEGGPCLYINGLAASIKVGERLNPFEVLWCHHLLLLLEQSVVWAVLFSI